jgi:hypothetical protein
VREDAGLAHAVGEPQDVDLVGRRGAHEHQALGRGGGLPKYLYGYVMTKPWVKVG